ncbi:16S rRNA (cytosine(1402)-N(4))-methyltransferase [Labilibaculum manganireducens]|uniref:Ribosomal RNA small subunit methyltransferase H n=1 Tax=Labilibaculum manganireducens TaxID=1940525 RepID=A0A2N3I9W2_9BACT|nr:16S rRNA (cytosine(1402)-N(4))-methyltransferase RsmH [Labilibaculum manganireducens]PKQ67122.1 16S rRNA (cytosine(1402)-N(4))-methyltransferase [Labilibaculum manganireducens]
MSTYHIPVLLGESIEGLDIKPDGIYVDLTFGGGGHSREILKHLTAGKLIGFDQDVDAEENVPKDDRFIFVRHNFRYFKNFMKYLGYPKVDGILADLGVSSHEFDVAERGFSFRFDGDLDMRMNQDSNFTAADLLNEYSVEDLFRIFKFYGEVKNPGKLVRLIDNQRKETPFTTIQHFKEVIAPCTPKFKEHKYLAQVFQAIRIEVNQEMDVLKEMLLQSAEMLKPDGRLVVITYHSLEDRLVKNFIRDGKFEGNAEKDFFGNVQTPLTAINRKVILPGEKEIELNGRARSAKLRIAQPKSL